MVLRAGEKFGNYELVKCLGQGSFGEVWLANWCARLTTTQVAIKFSRSQSVDINEIKREATLLAQVSNHPNIVKIYEANQYNNEIVIVTEFASDGSLETLLQNQGNNPVSIEKAYKLMNGMLAGLEELHKNQIIHRDLKPANILLKRDIAVIADFGLARLKTAINSGAAGTYAYMSPEAFGGSRIEQVDVWSMGVIFYELLTGRIPFPQQDPFSLMNSIIKDPVPAFPDSIPTPLQNVVKIALSKEIGKRYRSARAMQNALEEAWKLIQQSNLLAGFYSYNEEDLKVIDENFVPGKDATFGFHDSEIQDILMGQYRLLVPGVMMTNEQVYYLSDKLMFVQVKLASVKHYLKQVKHIKDLKVKDLNNNPDLLERIKSGVNIGESELRIAFESFNYHFISTLNILIKILGPTFEISYDLLQQYDNSGKEIIKILTEKKEINKYNKKGIDGLIEYIIRWRNWISSIFDWFNTATYEYPFISIGFTWDDKTQELTIPINETGRDLLEMLEETFNTLLFYCRDFVAGVLVSVLPPNIEAQDLTEEDKENIAKLWGMNLKDAYLKLGKDIISEYTPEGYTEARSQIATKYKELISGQSEKIVDISYNRFVSLYGRTNITKIEQPQPLDFIITKKDKAKFGVASYFIPDRIPFNIEDIFYKTKEENKRYCLSKIEIYFMSDSKISLKNFNKKFNLVNIREDIFDIFIGYVNNGKIKSLQKM